MFRFQLAGTAGHVFGALLLLLVIFFVARASRALCRRVEEPRSAVAFALGVMVMGTAPQLFGRLFDNLIAGVVLTGVAAAIVSRLLGPPANVDARAPVRPHAWAIAVASVATFLVVWSVLESYYFDEVEVHIPLTNVLARGVVPPDHPLYPGQPFHYHYAFAVIAGSVRAMVGLDPLRAIDVATIVSWALFLSVSWSIGRSFGGRLGGSLGLVLIPLGTGTLLFLLFTNAGPFEVHWDRIPTSWWSDWASVPPPVIAHFFQHPMGLGMPVFFAVLMLTAGDHPGDARVLRERFALGSFLLGLLSLGQVICFVVLGATLGVVCALRALEKKDWRRLGLEYALLLGALFLAVVLGGFFVGGQPTNTGTHLVLEWEPLFKDPWPARVLHHLVVFGVPLALVPFSFRRLRANERWIRIGLLFIVVSALVVANLITYETHILKFFNMASLAMNLLLVDVLAAWSPRRFKAPALALLIVLSTFSGWVFLLRASVLDGRWGVPRQFERPEIEVGMAVVEKLDPLIEPRTRIFTTNRELANGGGLLTPGVQAATPIPYLIDVPKFSRLYDVLQRTRGYLDAKDLAILDVDYAVLSQGDIDALAAEGRAALADPMRFEFLFDVTSSNGHVRKVYKIIR